MAIGCLKPANVDAYIAAFSPEVQAILEKVRLTIRQAAPVAPYAGEAESRKSAH